VAIAVGVQVEELSMNNPFSVGDLVKHEVDIWPEPHGSLKVIHIKNDVLAAVDSRGQKFIGSSSCFKFIGKFTTPRVLG